jgi:hypothetical protein
MRVLVLALLFFAPALAGCSGAAVKAARAVADGPPPARLHWVAQRDLDLEGELENLSQRPLDNLTIEATVEKVEKAPDGSPLTWTTSASVVYNRPAAEYRLVSSAGSQRTFNSGGGPDITLPPGERGGFLLQSVDKRMVRRIEVFRLPPGRSPEDREIVAVWEGEAVLTARP